MPTIKIKQPDGSWKYTNEPSSNADTLDGKHADEFALKTDIVNSDWNASEGEDGYIENRTHYDEVSETPIFAETELEFVSGNKINITLNADLQPDKTYKVVMDGVEYICICYTNSSGHKVVGNEELADMEYTDGLEPFLIKQITSGATSIWPSEFATGQSGTTYTHTFAISEYARTLKKLDPKFLPEGIGSGIDVTASVGQTIVVEEVDANGKPTKWKAADFQEKICGSEMSELLPETTIPLTDGALEIPNSPYKIDEGKNYRITWNGEVYECVAKRIVDTVNSADVTYVGNDIIVDGEDTGEPFAMGYENNLRLSIIVSLDDTITSATIKVEGEVTTKIPTKFIPTLEEMRAETKTLFEGMIESDENSEFTFSADINLVVGNTYKIGYNGVEYSCNAIDAGIFEPEMLGNVALGNIDLVMETGDTGEPFVMLYHKDECTGLFSPLTEDTFTSVDVYIAERAYREIPIELMPPIDEWLLNTTELFPLTELTFDSSAQCILDTAILLSVDQSYIVNWNGTPYTCVSFDLNGTICLGNLTQLGGTDTGEPFFIGTISTDSGYATICVTYDGITSSVVSVSRVERITKIPEACLPVQMSPIPEVSAANEGAFLRVVDGEWAAVQLPNAEDGEF